MSKKKNYNSNKNISKKQLIVTLIIFVIIILLIYFAERIDFKPNHLIAHSLSDEDANKKNLITGTRCFNVQGMLPIERLVLEYINKNQDNHVLYRVTPIFKGENLLASGVEMEAHSVEDNGKLSFNIFIYNIQPEASLNYATGELLNK